MSWFTREAMSTHYCHENVRGHQRQAMHVGVCVVEVKPKPK